MEIRRLGWAGVELGWQGRRIVIDLFEDNSPLEPFTGPLHTETPAVEPGVDAALVTHLHSDHADPGAIARVLTADGTVLRPAPSAGGDLETIALAAAEAGFAEHGLEQVITAPWETRWVAGFEVTAVPAVDGFGDPQISWVVEAGGTRVLHAGDTVFHGHWWPIAMRCGPIDVAFLPINGARCDFPHRQPPSPFPAVLDPAQAAAAAAILGAGRVVPIHYDGIHQPPAYAQADDPVGSFELEAAAAGFDVEVVEPGGAVLATSP